VFRYKAFMLVNLANEPADDNHSFLMAVPCVANTRVAKMKAATHSTGVDVDAILGQRSSLHQCAEVVGMA